MTGVANYHGADRKVIRSASEKCMMETLLTGPLSTPMFKILIADDHAVVRRGLRQIINDEPDFEVVGEAQNGQEVLEMIEQYGCDVVVLDITMPDKNGLVVLQEAKAIYPQLPVLILSMHPEDQFALRALKLGASGYLTKESAPEELVGALPESDQRRQIHQFDAGRPIGRRDQFSRSPPDAGAFV